MPLSFDLPLESLKSYEGTNPKPSDFDEFWQDGLNGHLSMVPENHPSAGRGFLGFEKWSARTGNPHGSRSQGWIELQNLPLRVRGLGVTLPWRKPKRWPLLLDHCWKLRLA